MTASEIVFSTEHTERQWPLSAVHSILVKKLVQPGEGRGAKGPPPFHYIYHHVQVVTYATAEMADALLPISALPLICTLWWCLEAGDEHIDLPGTVSPDTQASLFSKKTIETAFLCLTDNQSIFK